MKLAPAARVVVLAFALWMLVSCGGGGGDGAPLGSGAPNPVAAGTYTLSSPISYTCATQLVAINVSTFTFALPGNLTVTSNDAGTTQQPCVMSGATPADSTFDVTCTLPGTCTETYQLTGMMTGAKSWSGTLTASFTGTCFDCTMQMFQRTGTAP